MVTSHSPSASENLPSGEPCGRTGAWPAGEEQLPQCVAKEEPPPAAVAVPLPSATLRPSAWSPARAAPRPSVHPSQPRNDVTGTSVSSLRPGNSPTPWPLTLLSAARLLSRALSLTMAAGKEANPGAPLPTLRPSPANSAQPTPPHHQAPWPPGPASASTQRVTSLSWPSLLQVPASH